MSVDAGPVSSPSGCRIVYVPRYPNDEFLRPDDAWLDYAMAVAHTREDLARQLPEAEVLVIGNRSYDAEVAEIVRRCGSSLRLIQFSTSGYERGLRFGLPDHVAVTSAPGVKACGVAEHALALILSHFRALPHAAAAQTRHVWNRTELNARCRNLEDAVVMIVGLGSIGQDIARKLAAFDAHVVGVNRSPKSCEFAKSVIGLDALDEHLPLADVLVICAPAHSENFNLIGRDRLQRMRRNSLLVNVARGELVDEAALVEALEKGWISGAATDVAAEEPPPIDSPLWSAPHLTITPHIAGSGKGGYRRFRSLLLENLRRLSAGDPLLNAALRTPAPGDMP